MAKLNKILVVTNNFITADNGYGRACRDGLVYYRKLSVSIDYLEIVNGLVYFNGKFYEKLRTFSILRPTLIKNRLKSVPKDYYDLVVFEDLPVAINFNRFNAGSYLLRLHNVMAAESWPFHLIFQYTYLRWFERKSVTRMNTACLSLQMQSQMKAIYDKSPKVIGLVPRFSPRKKILESLDNIRFSDCLAIGTWGFRKRKDLIEIIKKWPDNITLHIVGRNSLKFSAFSKNNIVVHGYMERIDELVNKSKYLLNPQTEGSGLNIKTLFAIENGMVPLTTRFGAEGFNLVENINYIDIDNVDFSKLGSIDVREIIRNNEEWIRKYT